MPRLVKRIPRFARAARRDRFSSATQSSPALWAHLLAARSQSGVVVDPNSALTLTAYYAAVRVISEDVASLPVAVFKRQPGAGSKIVPDHPVSVLFFRSPDGPANTMPSMQWREAWIAHCLGWGNGYAEIEWSNDGNPLGLHLMHPERIQPIHDADGSLSYRDSSRMTGNGPTQLPAASVLHLAMLGFNGLQGYSPVQLAREAIGLGKAAEQYGASLFMHGAIPKGLLKHPGRMKPEAIANLRESWDAIHQGAANGNRVAILEEGMDWVATSIPPEDAQFLATRQFQVIEICRMLRLPPHKIGDYTMAHLNNIEAANLDYLMTTLRPWCVRVEQCLDLKLLSDSERRRGYYTRHDIRTLLRAAIKDRALYYKQMFDFGMSPNEVRELEDMNPIDDDDGGNKRFVSVNSAPLMPDPDAIVAPGQPVPAAPDADGGTDGGATGEEGQESETGSSGYSSRIDGYFPGNNGKKAGK